MRGPVGGGVVCPQLVSFYPHECMSGPLSIKHLNFMTLSNSLIAAYLCACNKITIAQVYISGSAAHSSYISLKPPGAKTRKQEINGKSENGDLLE